MCSTGKLRDRKLPDSRLTVSSGTTNAVANFKSTDAAAYIAIADNSSTNALVNQIGVTGNDMWFATDDVERMRIDSAPVTLVSVLAQLVHRIS